MSITASIHLHDDRVAFVVEPVSGGRGYVRIQTEGEDRYMLGASIHGNGPELRRLAAACLALADELDPPAEPTPPHDGWLNDRILAGMGHMRDRHDDPFGEGADR